LLRYVFSRRHWQSRSPFPIGCLFGFARYIRSLLQLDNALISFLSSSELVDTFAGLYNLPSIQKQPEACKCWINKGRQHDFVLHGTVGTRCRWYDPVCQGFWELNSPVTHVAATWHYNFATGEVAQSAGVILKFNEGCRCERLTELDARKPLVVSISRRGEELRL
jgi:hypothetical protein